MVFQRRTAHAMARHRTKGHKLGSQFIPGGGKQAILQLDEEIKMSLNRLGEAAIETNKPQTLDFDGIHWEIRPTGWTDSNGIHGHPTEPSPMTVFVASRLASDEILPKERE